MIVKDPETSEIMYSTLFVHWLPNNWIDRKNSMRECSLVLYQTKLFLRGLGMNEEDYPLEWDD